MITFQKDADHAQNHGKDENQSMKIKESDSPSSFSQLHHRIPVSSYLSKRVATSDSEFNRESMPARPMSANSALSFTTDYGQKNQRIKNSPSFILNKDINTSKTQNASNLQRGAFLTNPNEPIHNNGYDNVDGNLIVCEKDVIQPQSKCTYLNRGDNKPQRFEANNATSFRILHLLGQGTFAQVFKCEDVRTGNNVALKIIKNKPAYTNQALMEIEIFEALSRLSFHGNHNLSSNPKDPFVHLLCYFMYRSHLCLVFELLGTNFYEILKRRQFRGLPLSIVREFMRQALDGMSILSKQNIVHCDLKPENILLANEHSPEFMNTIGPTQSSTSSRDTTLRIKLIDFGSACFEGQSSHSYIQSRFYRSPEVLLGIDYDSAIDIWSLGCVAAELLLGLPILPGMNEHDQLTRICEMIGHIPNWMIETGTKASTHFVNESRAYTAPPIDLGLAVGNSSDWRLMSSNEYYATLSDEDKEKITMGKSTHRYFKRKHLGDIISFHGCVNSPEDKDNLPLFIHLLTGMLDIDPWSRFTAYQALKHPFLTGLPNKPPPLRNDVMCFQVPPDTTGLYSHRIFWKPPWDPAVTRRKLLMAQKNRFSQSFDSSNQACNAAELSTYGPPDKQSISYARIRIPSQSSGFSQHGSHPNLYALHQTSSGSHHSRIGVHDSSHQELYMTGETLPSPDIQNAQYYQRIDKDMYTHHSTSSRAFSQSFSDVYYDPFRPIVPGDLGLALQRPGVLPLGGQPYTQYEMQNASQHQLFRTHVPVSSIIRSGSLASIQGECRQWSYRNRQSNMQRNYPSSYSDVYGGQGPSLTRTVITPILAMQPVTIYQPVADYASGQCIRKTTNSLLDQQLSEYSSEFPVVSQSCYQTRNAEG